MTTQLPSEALHPDASRGISRTFVSTPHTHFLTPEFRSKVVEILSQTANGCLQELHYRPGMAQQLADLQTLLDRLQGENKKLYGDNKQLLRLIKELQGKLAAQEHHNSSRVYHLEQQIIALQKENQEILGREAKLALGYPAYAQLQTEHIHLYRYCAQLKQQIGALQKMVLERPPLLPSQHNTGSSQYFQVVEGGQPIATRLRVPQSAQEAVQNQQQFLVQGQPRSSQQIVSRQGSQVQSLNSHSFDPQISIPNPPRIPTGQPVQGCQLSTGTPTQSLVQANQMLQHHTMPIPQISRSSSSSSRCSNDAMEIGPKGPGIPMSKPMIHGWSKTSSNPDTPQSPAPTSHPVDTNPPIINPPRYVVSAPSAYCGQSAEPVAARETTSLPTFTQIHGPIVDQANPGSQPHPVIVQLPSVDIPPGMTVVPIGPPGKLLPPLTGSVMKPCSPPASLGRPSRHGFPPSNRATQTHETAQAFSTANVSSVEPLLDMGLELHTSENSQTPNLTPSSSRNSAAPSEGEPEATTPLDASINHAVDVVGSPIVEPGIESVAMALDEAIVASSLKRGNADVHHEEEVGVPDAEGSVRKKPRLKEIMGISSEDQDGDRMGTGRKSPTLEAMDEDDGDDEGDKIGPDGTRSVKYCLEAFTDEGDGVITCLLCLARHKQGLIECPTAFFPNAGQEEMVQHFLNEHPTAWEDLIHGRNR